MRRATPIVLTESQREPLERLRRGRRVSVRLAERAAIVLHAANGLENRQIGEVLGISRQRAGRWRDRYAASGLEGIEKDAPRPGRKRQISDKRRAAVVRKTLRQTPEGQTHWSRSTMAAATGLSESTIGRIWREHGLKPHRVRRSSCPTTRSSSRNCVTSSGCTCRRRNMPSCCRATRRAGFKRWIASSLRCP